MRRPSSLALSLLAAMLVSVTLLAPLSAVPMLPVTHLPDGILLRDHVDPKLRHFAFASLGKVRSATVLHANKGLHLDLEFALAWTKAKGQAEKEVGDSIDLRRLDLEAAGAAKLGRAKDKKDNPAFADIDDLFAFAEVSLSPDGLLLQGTEKDEAKAKKLYEDLKSDKTDLMLKLSFRYTAYTPTVKATIHIDGFKLKSTLEGKVATMGKDFEVEKLEKVVTELLEMKTVTVEKVGAGELPDLVVQRNVIGILKSLKWVEERKGKAIDKKAPTFSWNGKNVAKIKNINYTFQRTFTHAVPRTVDFVVPVRDLKLGELKKSFIER